MERTFPTIIAHRGASGYAPENTFAAFDKALALGFPDIEFDVRASRDGVPVVLHDATVDRTTDASTALRASGLHPVAELTLAQVKGLDAGSWFGTAFAGQRVPTLEEVFARYVGRARFQVEIKAEEVGLEVKAVALMVRYGVRASCVVSSFETSVIRELQPMARQPAQGDSGPTLPVRWLVSRLDREIVEEAVRLGASGLNVHIEALTPELAEEARARGLLVGAWGLEREDQVVRAFRCGVDGFTHNYPDVAKAQLERVLSEVR